ncbi:hypothetical protein ACHAWO_004908 [Cyclotella atomus]|uniref:Fcf2 pre-rRNA processing C-terminal domain-containing protein n=1 Tax=Cyclotella atomus TaxID=382360 RepID=A0ABD3P486_9STRA
MHHHDEASAHSDDNSIDRNRVKRSAAAKLKSAKSDAAILNATIDHDRKGGNELTHLLPGYIAPMRLETKSIASIQDLSVTQLRKKAEQTDKKRYNANISIKKTALPSSSFASKVKTPSSLSNPANKFTKNPSITTSFHNKPTKQNDNTAGSKWFHMNPTPMTDSLKSDLALIKARNYLDPKKFYKSSDSFKGKVLQLGTVIEGSGEYYSSRLTRKERRRNFTEEVMADVGVAGYAKRKFGEVMLQKQEKSGKRGRGGGGKTVRR